MERKRITTVKMKDQHDADPMPGTPSERIAMVRRLTIEACLLSGKYDPEQPMQRHIVALRRRGD